MQDSNQDSIDNPTGSNNQEKANSSGSGTPGSKDSRSTSRKSRVSKENNSKPKGKSNNRRRISNKSNTSNNSPRSILLDSSYSRNDSLIRTTNYSSENIATKWFNQKIVFTPYTQSRNKTLIVKYSVVPYYHRLIQQAHVFAEKVLTLPEVIPSYLFNNYEKEIQSEKIRNTFIYSYLKSLMMGIYRIEVSEVPTSNYVLYGHNLLYHLMYVNNGIHSFSHSSYDIVYQFEFTEEDEKLLLELCKSFPFIRDHMATGNRFFIANPEMDKALNKLQEFIGNTGPQFAKLGDFTQSQNHLTKENFGFFNSMYSNTEDINNWFYMHQTNVSIIDSSMLFGKALFLKSRNDEFHRNFYEEIKQDDYLNLVKYEVTCIAGSTYPDISDNFKFDTFTYNKKKEK
jgi:hypothetical protein